MKIYTKKGDDGSTGLYFGGRLAKDSVPIELNGAVDETQAVLGLVRSEATDPSLIELCIFLERELWILMAEVATSKNNRSKLVVGKSLVDEAMVERLEGEIDRIESLFAMPREFVVPGENKVAALLDFARTTARRAERRSLPYVAEMENSLVGKYLNRLSDLLWILARWQEGEALLARGEE